MRRSHVLAAVLLLVLISACTSKVGAPASETKWHDEADKVLGSAMSSLGTARIVLENAPRGRLPHPYVVVTMQDAVIGLDRESRTFLSSQPPDDLHAENQTVVTALGRATTLLTRVSTAVASPGAGEKAARPLLDDVRREYDALDELRTEVGAGS